MVKVEVVRRPSLDNPKSFLGYLFFTKMQVDQAAKILNMIISSAEPINETEWEKFVLTSRGLYVKVMRKLRDFGIVEKALGIYSLSEQFSNALVKMAEYWRDICLSNDKVHEF